MLVGRIQISGPRKNNFVKWKRTFRSDRQIRSVSVKGSHIYSQGADNYSMREGRLGSMFFFSLGWESDSPTRDRFSPHKRKLKFSDTKL